ncbi:MAG: hypothetical protein CMC94_03800 [Flavobacteriales bacterium]|nr:hypothetical protein [Flavobacteriales bacterium]|tara:strand:- start:40 stop:417 length:378 start_codon:yes stop_codon:yes gene_type:complete
MLKKAFLLIESLVLIIFLRLSLSFRGINRIIKISKSSNTFFICNKSLSRNVKAIEIISLIIPGCTCLIKAAALKIISPDYLKMVMIIGISNYDHFQSHAWIEVDNKVILAAAENQDLYKPILTIY